ncbi:Diacylglycerol kinase catalytic domain-containing protein [Gaiella occulta]|uniref:Diacylglycerol kinase catalytic domain-containing protein n=1 Tax=Gaiella occulta TaxID=1002870 RepID=A0A7M2YV90_9ACTN|nr:Diacylglycerol kinase catalytic domain-containing protein [Gaiella occulta]
MGDRHVRATLIVNPCASRVTDERLDAVARVLERAGELTIVRTDRRGHATELAREAAGADAIVAYGGDGLFNAVLNGVTGPAPVGFVPGGHTNVLVRTLGLPRDPVAAAARLVSARTRRISLGRVSGRRFAFAAGAIPDPLRLDVRRGLRRHVPNAVAAEGRTNMLRPRSTVRSGVSSLRDWASRGGGTALDALARRSVFAHPAHDRVGGQLPTRGRVPIADVCATRSAAILCLCGGSGRSACASGWRLSSPSS